MIQIAYINDWTEDIVEQWDPNGCCYDDSKSTRGQALLNALANEVTLHSSSDSVILARAMDGSDRMAAVVVSASCLGCNECLVFAYETA